MADFCKKCSIRMFGSDFGDLKGLCDEGYTTRVICEGCGPVHVDHEGVCKIEDCKACNPTPPPFVEYTKFPLNIPVELLKKLSVMGDESFTNVNDMIVSELERLVGKYELKKKDEEDDIEL